MSNYGFDLLQSGYQPGARTMEVEALDGQIVALMRCPKCHSKMHYEGYHNDGSYVALAVCDNPKCQHEKEF